MQVHVVLWLYYSKRCLYPGLQQTLTDRSLQGRLTLCEQQAQKQLVFKNAYDLKAAWLVNYEAPYNGG